MLAARTVASVTFEVVYRSKEDHLGTWLGRHGWEQVGEKSRR